MAVPKTTVIHHSADYDGLFCREIARKFLPDAEMIGWDFGDKTLTIPDGPIYILDLPVDRVFGLVPWKTPGDAGNWPGLNRIVWIDHHKSSIESHPTDIPGYRIDGVAACRLAWQWFRNIHEQMESDDASQWPKLPTYVQFKNREVSEPRAVRLAGEYDIWDKRDPQSEVFQFGLRSRELTPDDWKRLLDSDEKFLPNAQLVDQLLADGSLLQRYQKTNDASVVNHRSFMVQFEGLNFLALNTARCNSLSFAAKDVPETGHDALMGFYFNGTKWTVSLYHAAHRQDLDLSQIAVKHGGGGHRGACGFTSERLPFIPA